MVKTEKIREWIKDNNYNLKLLDEREVIESSKEKLNWECHCGNIFQRSWTDMHRSRSTKNCPSCSTKKNGEKQANYFGVEKIKELGYEVLDEYKGSHVKITLKDKEGYLYSTTYNRMFGGEKEAQLPLKFSKYNPYTMDNIENYIKIKNLPIEILKTTSYENNNTLLEWKCLKHNYTYKGKIDSVLSDKYKGNGCPKCIEENRGKTVMERNKDFMLKEVEEKGFIILDAKNYENCYSKILIKDKEGYLYYSSCYEVRRVYDYFRTSRFNVFNPYSIQNINNYLKLNNLDLKLISKEYTGGKDYMEWECSCGKIFKATPNQVLRADGRHKCPLCSKSKSRYERMTELLLKENNIPFEAEYKFKDCKDKNYLPFDFAILNLHGQVIGVIEVDGGQHYKPNKYFGGEEAYNILKLHEKMKEDFCKQNNIPLLRIYYKEFYAKGNYKNIILDFINTL